MKALRPLLLVCFLLWSLPAMADESHALHFSVSSFLNSSTQEWSSESGKDGVFDGNEVGADLYFGDYFFLFGKMANLTLSEGGEDPVFFQRYSAAGVGVTFPLLQFESLGYLDHLAAGWLRGLSNTRRDEVEYPGEYQKFTLGIHAGGTQEKSLGYTVQFFDLTITAKSEAGDRAGMHIQGIEIEFGLDILLNQPLFVGAAAIFML